VHAVVLPFLGREGLEALENLRIGDVLLSGLHGSNQVGLQMGEQQRARDERERLLVVAVHEDRIDLVGKFERHLPNRNRVHHGRASREIRVYSEKVF
jgi:hypothetical protein